MSPDTSRSGLATRGLIALAGSVVNGVAAFGVVIAVTRGLSSAASSGAVFAAVAVFNITYLVSTLGAEVAVVRFVARGDRREAGIARTAMAPAISRWPSFTS